MKYIIDTDKLPCNNGKNCTTCLFWPVDDTCEIKEQVKKLPKYEERPHGEWEKKAMYYDYFYCSGCGYAYKHAFHFCPNCGSDNRPRILDEAVDGEGKDGNVKEGRTNEV